MSLLTLSRIIIPPFVFVGFYCLHLFGEANGTFPLIVAHQEKRQLPTTAAVGRPAFAEGFTGVDPPDGLLSILVVFFWPLVDGENPGASLLTFLFGGQIVAFLAVVTLEASRNANKGRIITLTSIYGLLFQSIGAGVMVPLYLTIYLFTSPLVTSNTPLAPSALAVDQGILGGLPFGVLLGYIVPSIAMSLPDPTLISQDAKVLAIVVWQLFPVWTNLFTFLARKSIVPLFSGESANNKNQLSQLKTVYKLAMAVSVPMHVATWTLSLSTVLFPVLFTPSTVDAFHPLNVILPPNPLGDSKASSVAQGAMWFLQYDYLITSFVYVVWGIVCRYGKLGGFGLTSLLDVIGRCAIMGPIATALHLLQDRDEMVFAASPETSTTKKNA
ncbi:hypothetical protein LTS17_000659 [Exophiala oligosperma]